MSNSHQFTAIGIAGLAISAAFVAISSADQGQPTAPVTARVEAVDLPGTGGGVDIIDIEISECFGAREWGRTGTWPTGYAGIAISTQSHNVGTVPVDWFAPGNIGEVLDNRHPFIGQNMFRLREGRLEQIGQAFIKHGFFSENAMCDAQPDGQHLGVGCFDTYDTISNQIFLYLGPRSEINPLTGYWEPCGSHFDTGLYGYPVSDPGDCIRTHGASGHGGTEHRLGVADQDVLAADSSSDIFIEGFYIVAGDDNISNNWRHERLQMDWIPSVNRWGFTDIGPQVQAPVIETWADELDTAFPMSEGEVLVGMRTVDLGGGAAFRYEYNVYNLNLHREIDSFSVPLGDGVTLLLNDFHASPEDEEPQYATDDWVPTVTADSITWNAPAPNMGAGEEFPNTIRYGTMYTFWFVTTEAPGTGMVAVDQYKPGVEGTLTAILSVPCSLDADINGDGVVDTADLGLLISEFGTAGPASDLNDDSIVDTADLGLLISDFGADCFAG